jgi:plasmid maintenance system antidote protein VapI
MNRGYKKQAIRLHLERLEKARAMTTPQQRLHGKGEAEVVPGYELSEILREWVVKRLATNETTHEWLAEQTGIHVRRVSDLINGEFTLVPLSQADKLLQAIDRADYLANRLHVIPNPYWSPERWRQYMEERGC